MSGRVVETVFVFDRHAATDLSVAYSILVPERAARLIAAPGPAGPPAPVAGQEGRLARDQHREHQHQEQQRDQHQQHTPQCRGKYTGSRRRTQSPARDGQFGKLEGSKVAVVKESPNTPMRTSPGFARRIVKSSRSAKP